MTGGRLLRGHGLLDQRHRHGDVRRPAGGGIAVLVAYLALFIPRSNRAGDAAVDARIGRRGPSGWRPRGWPEYLRGGAIFGGFPWVPLGNSQVTLLPIAQLASVVGVFGLSAASRRERRLRAGATAAARRGCSPAVPWSPSIAVWGRRGSTNALTVRTRADPRRLVQGNIRRATSGTRRAPMRSSSATCG